MKHWAVYEIGRGLIHFEAQRPGVGSGAPRGVTVCGVAFKPTRRQWSRDRRVASGPRRLHPPGGWRECTGCLRVRAEAWQASLTCSDRPSGHKTSQVSGPPPRSFPVTDDALDAPDGAVVDGYERRGDRWVLVDPAAAEVSTDLLKRQPPR